MHPSAILVPSPDSMAFLFASAPRQGSRTSSSSSHSMFLALQLYTLNRKQQTPTVAHSKLVALAPIRPPRGEGYRLSGRRLWETTGAPNPRRVSWRFLRSLTTVLRSSNARFWITTVFLRSSNARFWFITVILISSNARFWFITVVLRSSNARFGSVTDLETRARGFDI